MGMLTKNTLLGFDDVFDRFFSPAPMFVGGRELNTINTPRVDVTEDEQHFFVKADLPGVKKEDIKVCFENGALLLETQFDQESKEEHEGKVIRQERRSGKYMRNLYLGENVEPDTIDATFTDGVLKLTVTKKEPVVPTTRQIEIH